MNSVNGRMISGLFLAAGLFVGCSSDGQSEQVGSLELQLQSQGSQGTLFGLKGTFVLSDPEGSQVTTNEFAAASMLTLSPLAGTYQLELCAPTSTNPACQGVPAYGLYRLECEDTSVPADVCVAQGGLLTAWFSAGAVLTTPNPQTVSISANQATTASFAFSVPGEGTIVFARGTLNVDLDVTEGFPDGQACSAAVECQSKVCSGTPAVCQIGSCSDGVQNGGETGPDCGGSACPACPTTQANCFDTVQNGDETGVDCGGSACEPCS